MSVEIGGKSVQLNRISKSYGTTQVLHDFSLTIQAGSLCTLLGASGSGKTTLLKLIAGFEMLDGGTIDIGGRDIGTMPVARRNIGMVFQNYALFPHMSVRANVAFGLEMRRVGKAEAAQRVDEALAMVGLAALNDRMPRQLSGGQQQRVALARALVIRPDILLMDEPLGALDKNLRQGLQLELKQLQARLGVTIVFVTHDQEEALHLSDQIVVMNRGRIEQEGSPWDLYLHPVNRFVASALGDCNCIEVDGSVRGVRPEKLVLGAELETHCRLACTVSDVIFLGSGLRVGLAYREQRLTALVPVDAFTRNLMVGQPVMAGCGMADLMVLAA